jgi:hypothetical protein
MKAALPPRLRKFAGRAGAVVVAIIALDLIATSVTLALGAELIKR